MSVTRVNTGAINLVFDANNAPTPGGSATAGNLLVWPTAEYQGSDATPTAPSGWTDRAPHTTSNQIAVYTKTATGGDTIPGVNWGNQETAGIVLELHGVDLITVIDVSGDRDSTTTETLVGPVAALTPNFNNAYVLFVAVRNRTSASGSNVFTAPTNFTMIAQSQGTGSTGPAFALCEWNQSGAPVTVPGNTSMGVQAGGTADATAQSMQGVILVFKAAQGAVLAGSASVGESAAATLTTAIQNAGAAMVSEAAVAALTNWATVTLVAPLYTGTGGILDPNFWLDETPVAGTTLYYDATNITIYANGEISSTTNNCSAVVQFFDGIAWSIGLVILTPQMVSYANVVSAAVGALTTGITFAGAALTSSSVAGGLSTGVLLAANAIAVSNAAASLLTEVQMNAAALTNVAATAALTGGVASLQGQASVLTQSIAALTAKIQLAGQVAVNSQVVGALTAQILFQGAANALTQAQGQLTTAIQLAGNVNVASTAAGAALISSQFAGAVNLVSTAMGSLSTGLLVAGTALVTVQAGGALSTGVQLAGGAVIDTEAAFTPPGVTGQFGYAQINVLSPTGLPVAQATFIEGSACIVTIDYFNALGAPFDPNAVSYQVSDVVSGAVLVPFTPVPGAPDLSNAITITGAQNTMVNNSRTSELHQVVFEITDGTGNVSVASAMFELIRLSGLN